MKYILFDLDGTLTDPYEGIIKSFQYAFSRFGIREDDPEKLRRFIGPPLRETFKDYGIDPEKAVPVYRERFGTVGLYENILYDGIPELLEYLKTNGFVLAIASSKAEVYAKKIAEYFNIARFFAFIGGASFDLSRSDKADVIQYVIDALDIFPEDEIYMVGDREHDINGAKKVGITSVGVLYGYGNKVELESAGADFIVCDVDTLRSLFSRILTIDEDSRK